MVLGGLKISCQHRISLAAEFSVLHLSHKTHKFIFFFQTDKLNRIDDGTLSCYLISYIYSSSFQIIQSFYLFKSFLATFILQFLSSQMQDPQQIFISGIYNR